jgi:hypothetical protein
MAPYTNFRTVASSGSPKTDNDASSKDIRSRQIDELIKQSEDARKQVYGPNHDEDCSNFYNLFERTRRMPTFRPRIAAPQLQLLLLAEAEESTDTNMRVFIHKKGDRDKERENAFKEHWRQEFFNLQTLMAQIYAQFSGTSFLQVGNDPLAKRGKGNVWLRARKQQHVFVDPISPWPADWSWVVIEDHVYLDQIKRESPDHADAIKRSTAKAENLSGAAAGAIEMPPGPMSVTMRGLPQGESATTDGPMRRRTCYCLDTTLRKVTDAEAAFFKQKNLPVPDLLPKYPQGRMIVECEGTILSDGHSWIPLFDMSPVVPVWAVPPWDSVWCPAPSKYTKSLQDAAEQQMTNIFENAKRMNNGMMIIHETTGLTANSVGGLPGEIVVVAANSPPQGGIEIKYPTPFGAQQTEYPMKLLALQKELRGATAARQGNLNPGNVGPDLFEAAVSQSQSGTRLVARLFSWSIQKTVELLFYTMATAYTEERFFRDKDSTATWKPTEGADDYEVQVPEGAVRPMSQSALRSMVIELKKAGMMSTRHALDLLDIPDAEEISEALEKEMAMAAIAKGIKK